MSFPVWRELKPILTVWPVPFRRLQCPFPFEGNWNFNRIGFDDQRRIAYNVLSRLKGIET